MMLLSLVFIAAWLQPRVVVAGLKGGDVGLEVQPWVYPRPW